MPGRHCRPRTPLRTRTICRRCSAFWMRGLRMWSVVRMAAALRCASRSGTPTQFARSRWSIPPLTGMRARRKGWRYGTSWSTRHAEAASAALSGCALIIRCLPPARERASVAAALRAAVGRYSGRHWVNSDPGLAPDVPAIRCPGTIRIATLVIAAERDLPDFHSVADPLASAIAGAERPREASVRRIRQSAHPCAGLRRRLPDSVHLGAPVRAARREPE